MLVASNNERAVDPFSRKEARMRRAILLLVTPAVVLAPSAGMAFAAVLPGTAGDDDLKGTGAQDTLFGKDGIDTLNGRGANDILFGQPGDDLFVDHSGDDLLLGGLGDDLVAGNPGDDAVYGGGGHDLLLDAVGRDLFSGGPDHDIISVPGYGPDPPELYVESDALFCGPGFDEVKAHPFDSVAADCEIVTRISRP